MNITNCLKSTSSIEFSLSYTAYDNRYVTNVQKFHTVEIQYLWSATVRRRCCGVVESGDDNSEIDAWFGNWV